MSYTDTQATTIWSVSVLVKNGVMDAGEPVEVVDLPVSSSPTRWDVASDDERLLVFVEVGDEGMEVTDEDSTQGQNTIHIISNWFAELTRLAAPEGE